MHKALRKMAIEINRLLILCLKRGDDLKSFIEESQNIRVLLECVLRRKQDVWYSFAKGTCYFILVFAQI